MMRSVGVMVGMAAVTALSGTVPPIASASNYGFELNGTYSAVSNGEWAKHNDSFTPEGVKRDVWRIESSCESTNRCDGTITSLNEGWTIPLRFLNDHWVAPRTIPDWAHCDTGPNATGHQLYWFYGVDESGMNNRSTTDLGGKDTTFTDSGSCGRNRGLTIELPLRLTKIS